RELAGNQNLNANSVIPPLTSWLRGNAIRLKERADLTFFNRVLNGRKNNEVAWTSVLSGDAEFSAIGSLQQLTRGVCEFTWNENLYESNSHSVYLSSYPTGLRRTPIRLTERANLAI